MDLVGNEEAVATFVSWLKSWTSKRGMTKKKACLLVGPPGVGKTSLARAAAKDFLFRVVELNASDVRTEKAIERALVPAIASLTLDSFSETSHGNLILLDEVDGVFGREDRGGLAAILSAIKDAPVPIALTANNVEDERFDDLRKACLVIDLYEIRPRPLLMLIQRMMSEEHVTIDPRTIEAIVRRSRGDIRSSINDVQAAAAGVFDVLTAPRTQQLDEEATLRGLFESHGFSKARRVLNETEIPLYKDELLLLLHDLLPYVYTSSQKLAVAYDSLSRADIAYGRIGASRSRGMGPPPFNMPRRDSVPQWNLLPVALNELASIGAQETDNPLQDALKSSPRPSRKTLERYQYRLWTIDRICSRLARTCHISKRTALRDVLPFLIGLFRIDEASGTETAVAMNLEDRDIEFLKGEANTALMPTGPAEMLDPADFKLPFMGKDKFIQLMRVGVKYDSRQRAFSVRRMDNLDSVEGSVSQIIGKPVKFIRPELASQQKGDHQKTTKLCYVDGREISCDACEFLEYCPTHFLEDLKYCVCKETLSNAEAYTKYRGKNQ